MLLRITLVAAIAFVPLSCKPRKTGSRLSGQAECGDVASESCQLPAPAQDFMIKLGKIEFIREMSRQFGIVKTDHPAITDLYRLASAEKIRRIRLRAIAVLAEVIEQNNLPYIFVDGRTISTKDIFSLLYLSSSKFKLCETAYECFHVNQASTTFFPLRGAEIDYTRFFADIRADLRMHQSEKFSVSIDLAMLKVDVVQLWQKFYAATGYGSLSELGKAPRAEDSQLQELRAALAQLMQTARTRFRANNDNTKVQDALVRDILVSDLLVPRPSAESSAPALTAEQESLVKEAVDSTIAGIADSIDLAETLSVYVDRINRHNPEDFSQWAASVRGRVALWYKSYVPNQVVTYPADALSPMVALRVFSQFLNYEMLLPTRDQWVQVLEDMARAVPNEFKDAATISIVTTNARDLLQKTNETVGQHLTALGFNAPRLLAKEKYLAKQQGFHSWFYQTNRVIVASMRAGNASDRLQNAQKAGAAKAKIKLIEAELTAAADEMGSLHLLFSCYDFRFGQAGSSQVGLAYGPNLATSPNWCAGWFSGYRKLAGVDNLLGTDFEPPVDGKIKLDNLCRYPDESRPSSFDLERRVTNYVMKLRVKEICDGMAMETTATTLALTMAPTGMLTNMIVGRLVAAGAQLAVKASVKVGAGLLMQGVIRSATSYTLNVIMGAAVFGWLNKTWYSLAGLQPWWDRDKPWHANLFGREYIWGVAFFAGMPVLQHVSGKLALAINSGIYGTAPANLAAQQFIRAPMGMRAVDFSIPLGLETAIFASMPFIEHWVTEYFSGNKGNDPTIHRMKIEMGDIQREVMMAFLMTMSFRVGHGANAVGKNQVTYKDYKNDPLRSLRRISERRVGENKLDSYQILGVSRRADAATIKKAYDELNASAKLVAEKSPEMLPALRVQLELAETAYQTLRDPAARTKHDAAWDREFSGGAYTFLP